MMGHELHRSGSFWSFLLSIDKDLAECTRQKACSCGGRWHFANYPRPPRVGPDDLPEERRRLNRSPASRRRGLHVSVH